MANIKELNKAIKVIENYYKDLEREHQFVIKPNKDIDLELCSVISVISKLSAERNICIGKYLFLLNKKMIDFIEKQLGVKLDFTHLVSQTE